MRKILIFSTAYLPLIGGAEIAVKEITDRLSQDISFDLITAKMRKDLPFREKIGNTTVYRLGIGIPFIDKLILPIEGALFARHLEKKNEYDAYWCIMVSFASGAAYLKNIFSKRKTPIILTLQEGDSESHLRQRWGGLLHLSWKLALARTRFLTAISTYLLNRAKSLGFKGQEEVVPNGVDTLRFHRNFSKEELDEAEARIGKKNGDIIVVTVSRLVKKNAVDDTIRALAYLPQHVRLVVAGSGPEEETLRGIAERSNLLERVTFLGNVSHDELPRILAASDVFVRPSRSEGFGNVFVEAMASGIPVIATPVGGITDFMRDPAESNEPTGLYSNVDDPESVARAIKKLLENPALREQIVINASRMVGDKYSWDKIAATMKARVFDKI